ncbi:ribosome biogenesis GTPase Der [Candidatus Saccharibacteria bacterium]|nr:ribosome biogenesis GTPase Der [Candidatus Saccharibacteria bacterium]
MSKTKVPIIAIVGRANVGKSSLFNSILSRREAIVADEPGTTRDSIMAKASFGEKDFWIVDTAGLKAAEDEFEFTIQEQIAQATDSADVIAVVVEAHLQITEEDRRVAKMALKSKKEVILVVNKIDKAKDSSTEYWKKLGIKTIFATSAAHNGGVYELLGGLSKLLPPATIKEDDNKIVVSLLGRPNVGKSALFNALGKKQQAIVADRAGTTRDINRVSIKYMNQEIEILDTAGIRRSGKIEQGVEKFSVIRSLSAIEQSDVCLLLIDVNELGVQLDQKIAGMIKEAGKGLILVVSKWDSAKDKDAYTRDILAPQIAHDFVFVPWAPLIFTSSVSGQNVTKIFDLVLDITKNRKNIVKTSVLNKWLQAVSRKHPPAGLKNKNPNLLYMIQEDNENPTFRVYGRDTKFLHWSYKRFMERELRNEFGFSGTPIKFWFFDRDRKDSNERRGV